MSSNYWKATAPSLIDVWVEERVPLPHQVSTSLREPPSTIIFLKPIYFTGIRPPTGDEKLLIFLCVLLIVQI